MTRTTREFHNFVESFIDLVTTKPFMADLQRMKRQRVRPFMWLTLEPELEPESEPFKERRDAA